MSTSRTARLFVTPRSAAARCVPLTSFPMAPFVVVCAALALLAAQSAAPTPLYPLYAERWGFTDFTTSAVFSVYIAALALTLLVTGSLSDHVGRRPVGVLSLVLVVVGLVTLACADGLQMLLLGRAVQGVAAGLGFGTLGAAMLDHTPPHRHRTVSVITGAMPPLAQGVGAVLSGAFVEFAPHPQWLGLAVLAVLCAGAAVGLRNIPERAVTRPFHWGVLVPSLRCPASVRAEFAAAAGALCASWALIGLHLGVGPTIARDLFEVTSPTVSGLLVLMVSGPGAVVGFLTFRRQGRAVMLSGAWLLVVGAGLMALSAGSGSFVLFCVASLVGGAGFGAAFQGGLAVLLAVTAPEDRGSTISLLYLVAYVAFGAPTLAAGLLVPVLGLGPVVQAYAGLVTILAIWALVAGRPGRRTNRAGATRV